MKWNKQTNVIRYFQIKLYFDIPVLCNVMASCGYSQQAETDANHVPQEEVSVVVRKHIAYFRCWISNDSLCQVVFPYKTIGSSQMIRGKLKTPSNLQNWHSFSIAQ